MSAGKNSVRKLESEYVKENMNRTDRVLLIMAASFALLGAVLGGVPGMHFSSCLFLCLSGISLVYMMMFRWKTQQGRILRRLMTTVLVLIILILFGMEAAILERGSRNNDQLPADAVIVLGAGVNGETPSPALQTRLVAARNYLEKHPDLPVVLSGGQGSGEDITEAQCMQRELRDLPNRLILEEKSTSTAENFAFSKELLEETGLNSDTAVVAVVTNDFHIFRAEVIARREGLQTVGVAARLPWWWLNANYYVREAFAMIKTLIFD